MTKAKIEPDRILCNFLRANVSDIHPTRTAPFIFTDYPRISNLGNSDFPRVGITILSNPADPMGIFDDDQYETITFQIDIVTKKRQAYTVTTTDEALGTMSATVNSNRFTFNDIPTAVTNIKHAGVAFGTVTQKATDSLFTAPASLTAGTVEYSFSTGNLNFSAADVTSYDTNTITSTYTFALEGKKACQYLAKKIQNAIKNNWRTDTTLKGLFYPKKIDNTPLPFDDAEGVFRQRMEYQFKGYNFGEGL